MRTRFTTAVLGSVLVLGLSPLARAGDPPAEDPASLLRRARVAETVDHDLPKAMDLYRKVFASAGDSDTSRDAALHLMDLLEARGDRPGALEFAKTLTDRFGARLDDAMKRQVHETMARTLPAGSHAKSPLGDVYVLPAPGSASNPAPSPLETKILAILSRLDVVEDKERPNVEASVLSALAPVGRDALPVLERVLYDSRPERARFAAQAIARIAPNVALPILLRAIKEGDGFARAAASGGLEAITPSPAISADFVAVVEPLLELPALAARRDALLGALAKHLDAAAYMDRFEREGERAVFWLYSARAKDPVVTVARLTSSARRNEPLSAEVVDTLSALAGVHRDDRVRMAGEIGYSATTPGVPLSDRMAALGLLARGPATTGIVEATASIAAAAASTAGDEEKAVITEGAWERVLDVDDAEVRAFGVAALARYGVPPSADVLGTPERVNRFADGAARALAPAKGTGTATPLAVETLLTPAIRTTAGPWEAIERMLASTTSDTSLRDQVADRIAKILGDTLPPTAEDARWLRVLARRPAIREGYEDCFTWMRRAAARTNDPRFLELARADLQAALKRWKVNHAGQREVSSYATALTDNYRGPGRAAFAVEMLETISAIDVNVVPAISPWARADDEFWAALLDRLPAYDKTTAQRVLQTVRGMGPPPSRFDARWINELQREAKGDWPVEEFVVAAAARSGSPEYLKILRSYLETPPRNSDSGYDVFLATVRHLREFPNPMLRTFLIESLADASLEELRDSTRWVGQFWSLLEADTDPAAKAGRLAIARNLTAPGNWYAIRSLIPAAERATLIEILKDAEASKVPLRDLTRFNLAEAAGTLHVREAIPFLTKEYARGSKSASVALDEIRTYYERLKAFEGFADGKDPLAAEIDAAKTGPTVELRRAAVFALAATHGAKAVPALLDIARTTADEPVRKAAIEMIEQIARGTAAGEPAGAAKSPAPAAPPVPAPAPTPGVDEPPTEK